MGYGLRRLPDGGIVEDAIQELAAWALAGIARGRSFNSRYLGLRFRSLVRDARRHWNRLCPPTEVPDSTLLDEQLDARAVLARLLSLPDGPLMVDAARMGVPEAAEHHHLTVGTLHVRMHRFRQRNAEVSSHPAI